MALREGLLLLLLAEGPRHGYELRAAFEQRTGRMWKINTGQVYTTLDRLRRDGLVEEGGGDGATEAVAERRRPYRISDEGRQVAEDWLDNPDQASQQLPRDELVMKVLLATQSQIDAAPRVIDGQRRRLLEQLQQLRRRQLDDDPALADEMCFDALVVRVEADLRWLDLCDERLRAASRTPKANRQTTKR